MSASTVRVSTSTRWALPLTVTSIGTLIDALEGCSIRRDRGGGELDGTLCKDARHRAPIFGIAVQIGRRVFGHGVGRVRNCVERGVIKSITQMFFDFHEQRPIANSAQREARG